MESEPNRTKHAIIKQILVAGAVSLGMGLLFDLFFFENMPGISFPLYVVLSLAVVFWSAYVQHRTIPRTALYIVPLLLFFSGMVFVRAGGLLTFCNVVISLYLFGLFVNLVFKPKLWLYKFKDYLSFMFSLPLKVLVGQANRLPCLLDKTALWPNIIPCRR